MKLMQNFQDEKTNKYITICQVVFIFLAGIFVLNIRQASFNNFLEIVILMSTILISSIVLIYTPLIKSKGYKYAWLIELIVFLIYLTIVFYFLKGEHQYLFKLIIIMPVIVLSLKYGLKMAFLSAVLIISINFHLSYLHGFGSLDADIILASIVFLLAWLLGHMTETQYENRAHLEEEIIFRKQVEKKQEEQLAFLQNLIDTIPHPIFQTNVTLQFTICNKCFEDFFGIKRQEVLHQTIWDIFPFGFALEFCSLKRSVPSSLDTLHLEYKLTNQEGSLREVIVNKVELYHLDEQFNGILGVILDQTEQKQFRMEMARMEKLNLVGEMAAGIAHEIRNPISTVKGFLQLYQIEEDGATLHNHVGLMIEELERANSIITVYLSLAKDKTTSLTQRQLNEVISSLTPLIQSDAAMTEHGVTFELNTIPEISLDEAQIKQLLLNFSRNGFDAMEKGGNLLISTYLENKKVVLQIKDQGSGIAPEIIEKLGTPFVTNKANGTGLGLAVCFSVAARHQAAITYDTGKEGTSFYVHFPTFPSQ